jgi:hypothetical protein
MSLFGKIFAILNIVAAIGFVVVAGMDWAQRERWEYSNYRHDLLVEGLPIDAQERDPEDMPRVEKLSPQTLNAILPTSTGPQVTTQQEEVDRIRNLVQSKINSNDVAGTKSQKLARYLRPLARTARRRDELSQLMVAPQNDAAATELEKDFTREFDGVREAGSDGKKHSLQERKENAARLLFSLGEALHEDPNTDYFASPAYKRLLNVVGLNGAARAVDDQALVLQAMTEEAIAAHDAELKVFINNLDQAVYRAQSISDAVESQDRLLKFKGVEVAKAKALVEERKAKIADLKDQLTALQKKTVASLANQARAEQEIMDQLIELRNTSKKNQELEQEIRSLEGVK